MGNRLAAASSPYLLQHADNPVDWYEWGDEAFATARDRDRPILLSVGYAACHWCHVMAHESFEDPATAAYMNEHFVNVKVDREERPDVDRIYMDAVQAMSGHGGWPMTVFLAPDGRPFFAGTYFPKADRGGHPSFRRVMEAVADAWQHRRDDVETQAERLTAAVTRELPTPTEPAGADLVAAGYEALARSFDSVHGGFGGAPKFPQAPALELLLRLAGRPGAAQASGMLHHTLAAMAAGGIYDHVGGGFARYAVDQHWLVPHFEKMLYDNALLARLYLRAWQVTGDDALRTIATGTLDYVLDGLGLPGGGLASSEDADSEGEEGKFYVWAHDEFLAAAGPEAALAADYFGVTPGGNFEGSNVLSVPQPLAEVAARHGRPAEEAAAAIDRVRERLRAARDERVRPGLDDKVVTAWNGLALRALAEAGAILGDRRYLDAGRRLAGFLLDAVVRPDGRLLRSWRDGRATIPAFCEDYGAMAVGLFALYQATGELRWFEAAARATREMLRLFADRDGVGFFATGSDAPELIDRPKDVLDNPAPAGNSLAAEALLHLRHYTGDADLDEPLDGALALAGLVARSHPHAVAHALAVLSTRVGEVREVAVVGATDGPLVDVLWAEYRPGVFPAVTDGGDGNAAELVPLLAGRVPHSGEPRAYVCTGFVCDAPTSEPGVLAAQLAH